MYRQCRNEKRDGEQHLSLLKSSEDNYDFWWDLEFKDRQCLLDNHLVPHHSVRDSKTKSQLLVDRYEKRKPRLWFLRLSILSIRASKVYSIVRCTVWRITCFTTMTERFETPWKCSSVYKGKWFAGIWILGPDSHHRNIFFILDGMYCEWW